MSILPIARKNKNCAKCHTKPALSGFAFCSKTCAKAFPRKSCSNCSKPCFVTADRVVLEYCGNYCKSQVAARRSIKDLVSATTKAVPLIACLNCKQNRVFHKKDGSKFPFCGRSCANSYQKPLCGRCKLKDCHVTATGVVYPYCSKFCASSKKSSNLGTCPQCKTKPPSNGFQFCSKKCAFAYSKTSKAIAPSCPVCFERPLYVENGKVLPFCGKTCGKHSKLSKSGHGLIKLTDATTIASVKDQFSTKWMKNSTAPNVQAVYKVLVPSKVKTSFLEYSKNVATDAKKVPRHMSHGKQGMSNVHRRFHGTRNTCGIGISGKTNLCNDPSCSTCQIIKSGFKVEKCGSATGNSGRFGKGIYFSATSGKAADYVRTNGQTKTVFVASVVVGDAHLADDNFQQFQGAVAIPQAKHSILAKPGVGGLNYDEICVPQDEACVPLYLIEYQ